MHHSRLNFFKNKDCAELITNNRNINFTNSIRKLSNDEKLRKDLGMNGYNEIINNYSKEVIVSKYANLLNSL